MSNHCKPLLSILFFLWHVSLFSQSNNFSSFAEALAWARSSEQKLEEAVPVFDKYIEKASAEGFMDTVSLLTHYKAVKYYRIDIDSALAINERAIKLRMQEQDREGASRSYYNQGLFYNSKGDQEGVKESFEAILGLDYSKDNPMFVSSSYRLSLAERDRGDYERGLYYLDIAFQPLHKDKDKSRRDSTNLALLHHAYSTIYNQMGDSLLSLKAKDHLNKEIDLYKILGLENRMAAAYFELGSAYENLHQYDSAIFFFEAAKSEYTILGDEEMINDAQNNLSLPLRKLGRFPEALAGLQRSLRKHQATVGVGPHPAQARLYDNLAEVYLAKGEVDRAILYFQQAIANIIPFDGADRLETNPNRQSIEDLANKEDLLTYLRDKARAWQVYYKQEKKQDHLEQALATLLLADFVVDLMRTEHLDAESKLFWRKKVHPIYEEGLSICYTLGDAAQAYYFMEKSKAVLLLDALMEMDTRKWIDPDLANQEMSLNERLIELRQGLQLAPDDAGTRREILDAQNQLQAIREKVRKQHPEYYDLRYKTAQLPLEEFDNSLRNGTASIHFFWGESSIFVLSIGEETPRFYQIETAKVKPLLLEYLTYFERSSEILEHPINYQLIAHQLYQTLLEPVIEGLKEERLILMPDGLLHNLPFEALITIVQAEASLGEWKYLQSQYQLSYAYSATILAKQMESGARPNENSGEEILALAPFADVGNEDWGPLSYSDDELKDIQSLGLAGSYKTGKEANYSYFLSEAANFGVLHLSTHAAVNAKAGEPFIDFNDRRLYLRDLYRLQLPVDLVVLSACQTNLGELKRGEGVMSLNRGFTYAGAKSLISSLWRVNDRATAQIFRQFYDRIKEGDSKAQALHAAKRAYLSSVDLPDIEKSPYYWAGFIHYGADSTLALRRRASTGKWLLLVGLTLVSIFLIWRFIRRSNA